MRWPEVSEDGEEHFVEDLLSTNGTYLGPSHYRIGEWKLYQLVHGKQVAFGPTECRYEYVGVSTENLGEERVAETVPKDNTSNTFVSLPSSVTALENGAINFL